MLDDERLIRASAAYVFGVMPGDESEASEDEIREMTQRVLDASGYPTEVMRLREALEQIADGSFKSADEAADFAIKAMDIAVDALNRSPR